MTKTACASAAGALPATWPASPMPPSPSSDSRALPPHAPGQPPLRRPLGRCAAGDHPARLSNPGRTIGHPPATARAQQVPGTPNCFRTGGKTPLSAPPNAVPPLILRPENQGPTQQPPQRTTLKSPWVIPHKALTHPPQRGRVSNDRGRFQPQERTLFRPSTCDGNWNTTSGD